MPDAILPSFAKGELDPALHGRVDTAAYQFGLAKARNVIINSTGGVMNRAGTLFVGPVKDHQVFPRLIEFQFKTSDQYILELGDKYMRVIRDDGHVLESSKAISAITAANPPEVTTATHSYTTGDEVYISGIVGMTELNDQRFKITVTSSTKFTLQNQLTGDNVDASGFTAWSSAGTSEKIFELVTPWDSLDVDFVKFTQSADVMTMTHPGYAPVELARTDHDAWTVTEIAFIPDISHPTGLSMAIDGADNNVVYKYFVTAIDKDTGEESLPGVESDTLNISAITKANPAVVTTNSHSLLAGDIIHISSVAGMTELNDRHFTIGAVGGSSTTFELQNEDSSTYTTYSSGGTVIGAFTNTLDGSTLPDNTITWTGVSGASRYNIYRREAAGSIGFIGESLGLSFKDDEITANEILKPPQPRNPFIGTGNFPGSVGYYEQRRVFGNTNNKPDTVWYSKTGAQSDMSVSSPGVASDAITSTLSANKVNEIRHFIPGTDLLIFTSGSEWRASRRARRS